MIQNETQKRAIMRTAWNIVKQPNILINAVICSSLTDKGEARYNITTAEFTTPEELKALLKKIIDSL